MDATFSFSPLWSGLIIGAVGVSVLFALALWRLSVRYSRSLADCRLKIDSLQTEINELTTALAVSEQQVTSLSPLEATVKDQQMQLQGLSNELQSETARRIKAEQANTRIDPLERLIEERDSTIAQLQNGRNQLNTANAELTTRLEEERKQTEQKLELIKSAEQQMVHQFQSLSAKILEEKSKTFTQQNQTNLDRILAPLREQLGEFKKKVDDVYVEDSKDRASLREAIKNLNLENQKISQEANNLARALKGDKKLQGTWGELVLEKVLEQSGLRKGIEYHTQGGFRDTDNRLLKPDVIVHLPEEKDVIIDSKVSLVAYETYAAAESDDLKKKALGEHVQAIKAHIKGLSEKDYTSIKGIRSLDFVLMFMPIETAFVVAFEFDHRLFTEAFQHNIIVVTPTTLLATLRTIENIWRFQRQNENAKIIAGKAANLYDKLRGFVEDFDKLGTQISTVQLSYDNALNKLSRGKGNLLRQADSFVELGVKVKKTIPKSLLDRSTDSTVENDFDRNAEQ